MDLKEIVRRLTQAASEENLSFDGNGGVSVPIESIVRSEQFREQLNAVRQIADLAKDRSGR